MTKMFRHKWRAPGIKGMLSAADPRDVPAEYATYAQNVDFAREYGTLRKSYGFDRHDVDQPLPENFPPVLSMGWMTYTNENDAKMGRLIVQCNGDSGGQGVFNFDWYYREYSFYAKEWLDWPENSLSENDIFGTTKVDRIRWTPFHEVLRGACGNESDSYPLWFGYINRDITDNEGYFHDYTFNIDQDMRGYNATVLGSTGLPTFDGGLELDKEIQNDHPSNWGFDGQKHLIYAVPVIDGHQILSPQYIDEVGDYKRFLTNGAYSEGSKYIYNYTLYVYWLRNQDEMNPRLTGFNIYMATRDSGISNWESPVLIRAIDIRTNSGDTGTLYGAGPGPSGSDVGLISDGSAQGYDHKVELLNVSCNEDDLFNNFFVDVKISDDNWESYRILDQIGNEAYFNLNGDSQIVNGTKYGIEIKERWRETSTSDLFAYTFRVDTRTLPDPAPTWLPMPWEITDEDYEYIPLTCNYKHAILFEERHIVGNVYFDGKKHPLMMRWSNPTNDPFAGHDIFPNYVFIPSTTDDEIMGFAQSLNVLSVFTKRKIFKYVFESGIPTLQETEYNVGLVAPDSLVTINGIHWFFGQKGQILSVFRYDGIRKPKDVGAGIRDQLEAKLTEPYIQPHLTLGWRDYRTGQYRIALNTYSEGDPWYLPGSPGSGGLGITAT